MTSPASSGATGGDSRADAALTFDYLVLGSGIAGLTFALKVAALGTVAVITKKDRADSNTNWAQGGIAGVLAPDDSFELHIEDTLIAGAGLCHRDAVEVLVREGPERILELVKYGAEFNKEKGTDGRETLALTREGGHSRRRIVFNDDLTGREVEKTLVEEINEHPSISVFEHHNAIDFAKSADDDSTVCGVYVLDNVEGEIINF
ncbi:MAG TPA: FAD-binding protein, partial [Armatimonadaceae bacterium]|nr:FAD-binding protein [Armatimonadaceae bacterium]